MKILAVYNIKGGVGKTAAAVNLSYLAAQEGHRTLICDLDPQGSATYYFRIKPKLKAGSKVLVKSRKKIDKSIKGTDYENLDLLPADFSFRNLDLVLDSVKRSRKRLRDALASFVDDYTFIFLDCPPNITLVSENVFHAADFLIIPVIPTTLSVRTFDKIVKFFKKKNLDSGKLLPFFSMVELRKKMHKEMITQLLEKNDSFLQNRISYSSDIEKMGLFREPVVKTFPHSTAVQGYFRLWDEIKDRIKTGKKGINAIS
jgi:chromosome partitioning protein